MSKLPQAKRYFDQMMQWMTDHVAPVAKVPYPKQWVVWQRELEAVQRQLDNPNRIQVALVGTTGAGKSTFLNALLGQELLPVGVMEPCTSFVTLVRYQESLDYSLQVDFFTQEQWQQDLESLVLLLQPGESENESSESKRFLNAAKKRVQAVLGRENVDQTEPQELFTLPLPPEVSAIFEQGSSQTQRFETAKDMLTYLRSLIRSSSTLWSLVKQVSISGPYTFLQGGIELVDLPGLNDPNEARIEVTRDFLRTAPFVWVMFSMVRGLTQDIHTILEEEKLLRTMVLSGSYASLSLIGTKADDIDTNIAPQLGLDEDTELPDLIRAYREQTTIKARAQLEDMVRNFPMAADEEKTLQRMIELTRAIEVHTTSATAYCRLQKIGALKKSYNIENEEDTGIPAIHRLLERIDQEAGAGFMADNALKRLTMLGQEISFFLRNEKAVQKPELETRRETLQKENKRLKTKVKTITEDANMRYASYREGFTRKVAPLLENSTHAVQYATRIWQGIHWATLKATVSNQGVYRSPSNAKSYDLNTDLTEILLNELPLIWERYFIDDLGRVRDQFVQRLRDATNDYTERTLENEENSDANPDSQLRYFQEIVRHLVQQAENTLKTKTSEHRRELAREIPKVAQKSMQPAYQTAKLEFGTGMKNRIIAILQTAATEIVPQIYETIRKDLFAGISELEHIAQGVLSDLAEAALRQAQTIAQNATLEINEAVIDPRTRALLESIPSLSLQKTD
jgi:hypothetical protein